MEKRGCIRGFVVVFYGKGGFFFFTSSGGCAER